MRTVGIKEFRANLSRWIDIVKGGEDVLITERGRPVARMIGPADRAPLERLIAQGLVIPASRPKRPIDRTKLIKAKGSVSEFVKEQRR